MYAAAPANPSPCLCPVDRVQKLKDARSEASKEIEAYKKAKEEEFKAFEASVRAPSPCSRTLLTLYTACRDNVQRPGINRQGDRYKAPIYHRFIQLEQGASREKAVRQSSARQARIAPQFEEDIGDTIPYLAFSLYAHTTDLFPRQL